MKKFKFTILIFLAIIALVLGQLIKDTLIPPPQLPPLSTPLQQSDWQRGRAEAQKVVVMYGDFTCLICAELAKYLSDLTSVGESDTTVIYRHFANASSTASQLAAAATEAAGKQKQFWPMHDLLYERQSVWVSKEDPTDLLLAYAASLHLNLDRFQRDIVSTVVLKKVEADYQSGVKSGVSETPALFLNGTRVQIGDL